MRIEPRALHVVGKHSATELWNPFASFLYFTSYFCFLNPFFLTHFYSEKGSFALTCIIYFVNDAHADLICTHFSGLSSIVLWLLIQVQILSQNFNHLLYMLPFQNSLAFECSVMKSLNAESLFVCFSYVNSWSLLWIVHESSLSCFFRTWSMRTHLPGCSPVVPLVCWRMQIPSN